ncbi:putative fructan beta-fructosidase [Prevotella sp. oral taxon 306 str. F0472]|nr:putative fructan beta-fructosidase [Prevotella sp. oral taxon 306 str. F0472]
MTWAICLFTSTTLMHAQSFLSQNHAIKRVITSDKYILLPVEEDEHNAHIRVIKDNQVVKEFNCKLAINKTDYSVPLDISEYGGDVLLDIQFTGDKRSIGLIKDFACWKDIKLSSVFDTKNREKFRPIYHHTPAYGWMNDPNGMFYKDGVWHLYYQYNPYGSQWENMTWAHSTSTDLMHWENQGEVIQPDALGTIFSGNSVVDKENTAGFGKDVVIAFYTSAGNAQTQSIAYSTDNGMSFKKYANNPIITSDVPDFRDPKVFWNDDLNQWNLILASGQQMNIYSSKNLKDWKYESCFGEEYGNHGGVWECPDLLKIGDKWVLICNINPGGPFGGSATQYFVGTFDGHKFTCESKPEVTKWMDYGKDHYATVSFSNAPNGRIVVLPWMSNWQYANQVPTQQFRSANGLPRDVSLYNYNGEEYVSVKPSPEVLNAFEQKASGRFQMASYLEVTNIKSNASIVLSNDKDEYVTMVYDGKNGTFSMDRTQSGLTEFHNDFKSKTIAPTNGTIKGMQIFVDRCSIEAFDIDGKVAMSNLVFPSKPYDKIVAKGCKVKVHALKDE